MNRECQVFPAKHKCQIFKYEGVWGKQFTFVTFTFSLFHFLSYIHIFNLYIYLYTHLYFNCWAFSTWAIRLGGLGNHPLPYWHKINCIVLYCAQVPQKKRFVQGLDTEAWSLWRKSFPFRRKLGRSFEHDFCHMGWEFK